MTLAIVKRKDDKFEYRRHQAKQEQEWEARCHRCGACCGAQDDPCRNLIPLGEGRYRCSDYANRLGMQKTISGESFRCVPIRNILKKRWPGDERCGYKMNLSS